MIFARQVATIQELNDFLSVIDTQGKLISVYGSQGSMHSIVYEADRELLMDYEAMNKKIQQLVEDLEDN